VKSKSRNSVKKEADWLASRDPTAMLETVRATASLRKLYLLCVACGCMYKFNASGLAAMAAMEAAAEAEDPVEAVRAIAPTHPDYGLSVVPWAMTERMARYWRADVGRKHAPPLIREVFGNPFRPVAFDATWRSITAVALARQMYDSRDFSAMPILADSLQDAGCEDEQILAHCRGNGPHVRGCWVVDLVLGKE
jgi:hypothetical protein